MAARRLVVWADSSEKRARRPRASDDVKIVEIRYEEVGRRLVVLRIPFDWRLETRLLAFPELCRWECRTADDLTLSSVWRLAKGRLSIRILHRLMICQFRTLWGQPRLKERQGLTEVHLPDPSELPSPKSCHLQTLQAN